jgi:hypothetical protein
LSFECGLSEEALEEDEDENEPFFDFFTFLSSSSDDDLQSFISFCLSNCPI